MYADPNTAIKDLLGEGVWQEWPEQYRSWSKELLKRPELTQAIELHRLPVIENDQLVGLVTEGTIAEASPSKATSLAIEAFGAKAGPDLADAIKGGRFGARASATNFDNDELIEAVKYAKLRNVNQFIALPTRLSTTASIS